VSRPTEMTGPLRLDCENSDGRIYAFDLLRW
jgi:hypothetical protein